MTAMLDAPPTRPFRASDLAALPDDGRRYELVDGCLVVRGPEPLMVDDLDAMPEDGRRYELIDGVIYVTPAPGIPHQLVLGELYVLLRAACPPGLRAVLGAGYRPGRTDQLVPDLFVARRAGLGGRELEEAPPLAVEVASPSTARYDRGRKLEAYQARGVPSYWLVDPRRPSITVLELRDGRYEEAAVVAGDRELAVERPFPVRVVPAALLAGLPGGLPGEEGDGEMAE